MAFSTLPITTVGLSITTFVSQNVGAENLTVSERA